MAKFSITGNAYHYKEIAEYGEDDDGEDHDALKNVTNNIIFRNLDRRRR